MPVIQTPPDSIFSAHLEPIEAMVSAVASIIGGDPDARELALTSLDRAADRMNMAQCFLTRWTLKEYTDLTLGQATLEKPFDWGWPLSSAFVLDATDKPIERLEWKRWEIFAAQEAKTAIPLYLSLRNQFQNDIYIWPQIDTAKVSKIQVPYLAKILRPSEAVASDLLLVPELREALIAGGIFFVAQHRYLKQPQIWRPLQQDFERCIDLASGASRRWLEAVHDTPYPDTSGNLLYEYDEGNRPGGRL